MATIQELRSNLAAAVKKARASNLPEDHAAAKAAGLAVAAAISAGAKPCPKCEAAPHGMVQQVSVGRDILEAFDVGCLACHNHCARGFTPELAVDAWNRGVDAYADEAAFDDKGSLVIVPAGWRKPR